MAVLDAHYNPGVDPLTERRIGLARAQQLLGTANLHEWFIDGSEPLAKISGEVIVGGASRSLQTGGFRRCTTSAAANDLHFQYGVTLDGAATTKTIYQRTRFRVATAVDTVTTAAFGLIYAGGNEAIAVGVNGVGAGAAGGSDTAFSLCKFVNTGPHTRAAGATSSVAIDTAWHTAEWWFDGTLFYLSIDSEPPVSTNTTGLSADATYAVHTSVRNSTTAAARTLDQSYYQVIWLP